MSILFAIGCLVASEVLWLACASRPVSSDLREERESSPGNVGSNLRSLPTGQWLTDEEVLLSRRPALTFAFVTVSSIVFIMFCAKQWEQFRLHQQDIWMQAQRSQRRRGLMSMESWLAKTTGTSNVEEMENLVGTKEDDSPASWKYRLLEEVSIWMRTCKPFILGLLTLAGTLALHVGFVETCRSSLFYGHLGSASWLQHISMYWGFDDQVGLEWVQGEALATVAEMLSHINASYMVSAGTLLPFARLDSGAARMIPWDNDGDVHILHSDLEKLARTDFSELVDDSIYEIAIENSEFHTSRGDDYIGARLTHRHLGRYVNLIQLWNMSERMDTCSRSHIRFDGGHKLKLDHCQSNSARTLEDCKAACTGSCEYWEFDAKDQSCRSCSKEAWEARFPGHQHHLVGAKDCIDEIDALQPEFSTKWSRGQVHCFGCRHAPGEEEYAQFRVPQATMVPTQSCPAPYLIPSKRKVSLQCPRLMKEALTYAFGEDYQQPPPGKLLCGIHKKNFGLLPFLLLSAFVVVLLDIWIGRLCSYTSYTSSSAPQKPAYRQGHRWRVKGMSPFEDGL